MRSAIHTGIFCGLLIGFCFLLSGLTWRALSLDPLVPFSMMAGVLVPATMVVSGMLARWAASSPFDERPPGSTSMASLASGLVTALSGAGLCGLMLALSESVFPPAYAISMDAAGLGVIFVAYVAMSAIGGELYGVMFPELSRIYGRHHLSVPSGHIDDDERRSAEHTRGDTRDEA
ncbi:hypothetical protein MCP_0359 [Methanocella paludicola SANAE]|uniref:Uncharacterized protein n=1 Tax=Methanocella paludicola (strain DSM 17711 / JCM 13418 / NBRC 101707 / SANAE) TaxID=304371 RepID=D1YVF9_METPS|nr:hypothetical protein [Methanocella paludicola]BAI60431.1 hypothetical protein MCP_0359 [Methanocella paludicola SANAE]